MLIWYDIVIEDFFRLLTDAVRFYPKRVITSALAAPIFSAGLSALTLQQIEPLTATLHYYYDLLSFGFEKPTVSEFNDANGEPFTNPPEVQAAVKQLISSEGHVLVQRVLTGMMFSLPGDCFPDASAVLMLLFQLAPREAASWVESTVQMLPSGTLKQGEADRLLKGISENVQSGETRKVRVLLQGS